MRRVKSLIRKLTFLHAFEDMSAEQRRKKWPIAQELSKKHIQNCRLIVNRDELLNYVPKNSVGAEVGIDKCLFSETIMEVVKPSRLHLYDISKKSMDIAQSKFSSQIENEVVILGEGDSSSQIDDLPSNYFDWVYIDGDHRYEGCKKDLEASHNKLKPDGCILLNDYIYFSPSDFQKYGVIEATNEFCIKYNYEFIYMALQGRTYNDVMLKKISD